jgi:hypothetical protein
LEIVPDHFDPPQRGEQVGERGGRITEREQVNDVHPIGGGDLQQSDAAGTRVESDRLHVQADRPGRLDRCHNSR